MSTSPTKPVIVPDETARQDTDPTGHAPNGTPDGTGAAKPTGHPTSDRHETETAAETP